MSTRDYTFLGTTHSLCPHCRRRVDAKIVVRDKRVYLRKRCPEHGAMDDFVCSDVEYWDRNEFARPARQPKKYATDSDKGCPHDCGICPEHEQHTCIALVEITTGCNLKCPMCFAESGPGGTHVSFDTFTGMVDRLVEVEGVADVLQISGGEPTLHPDLPRMVRYAHEQPIQAVMINTNGIRLAKDRKLAEALAPMRDRLEIYLQFDGFDPATHTKLRGEELLDVKRAALEVLSEFGIRTTLVCTVAADTNLHEVGAVLQFGLSQKIVRGVSYQLATFCGRHTRPEDLEQRATMPDLVKGLVNQTAGMLDVTDFMPLPCAHPNCHMLAYLYRGDGGVTPISRLIDVRPHLDLIANSIVYTPARAKQIAAAVLNSVGDCGCGPSGCGPVSTPHPVQRDVEPTSPTRGEVDLNTSPLVGEVDGVRGANPAGGGTDFLAKALAEQLNGEQVFRVTLTSFLDAHTFDTRQAMKCCIAHVLPSGHVVPFCTYNTLYRDGHLPLPPLADRPAAVGRKPLAVTHG